MCCITHAKTDGVTVLPSDRCRGLDAVLFEAELVRDASHPLCGDPSANTAPSIVGTSAGMTITAPEDVAVLGDQQTGSVVTLLNRCSESDELSIPGRMRRVMVAMECKSINREKDVLTAHFRRGVYYDDDGGTTWKRSEGDIVIWKDDGFGGMWCCDEPNVVELSDGRLLMVVRTRLGRICQASSPDGGVTWDYPESSDVPTGISPCSLKHILETPYTKEARRAGDLLLVWNNVSADELRRGFRRGRLFSAISRHEGKTWEHGRTLDAAGLPPLDWMAEVSPPGMGTRGNDNLRKLPVSIGAVSHLDIAFAGEKNVLVKHMKVFSNPAIAIGDRLQILPLN